MNGAPICFKVLDDRPVEYPGNTRLPDSILHMI